MHTRAYVKDFANLEMHNLAGPPRRVTNTHREALKFHRRGVTPRPAVNAP